jgi:hypothetical protein
MITPNEHFLKCGNKVKIYIVYKSQTNITNKS